MNKARGSISSGLVWMIVLSILLFWLPLIGPFIAGLVGGKKAGSVGNALTAVAIPAAILAATIFLFSSFLLGLPVLGLLAGAGVFFFALLHVLPMLLGAVIGGAVA
jgi:hypothetical protein